MVRKLNHILFFIFIFCQHCLFAGQYQFEGYFKNHDGEMRYQLIALFLPYNPAITIFEEGTIISEKCSAIWPKKRANFPCDLIWIDSQGNELSIIRENLDLLSQAKVIYTTTEYGSFNKLKPYLESAGFTLLSHWYWEGEFGHAIFLKNELFNIVMKSLNYFPVAPHCSYESTSCGVLEQFFQPADNKPRRSSIDQIDQVYMINLDQRPEKFALTANHLRSYGIDPYRFSAVNGWELPNAALNKIGVKYHSGMSREIFMGTVYREIDGKEYQSNEYIQEEGVSYFSLGMSRGAIGIVISHLSILQDAYDSGYHTIWVMEDDVEVIEDPKQLPGLIQQLDLIQDDWDILFTDTDTKDSQGNHVPCRAMAARVNFNMDPISTFPQRFYPISADLSRIGMRYGAYSMIIRRTGMKKILDYYKTYQIFLPYDMDFWLIPDLKMYCPNKDIVSHRAGSLSDNGSPNYKSN